MVFTNGAQMFRNNQEAISKFQMPEGWHVAVPYSEPKNPLAPRTKIVAWVTSRPRFVHLWSLSQHEKKKKAFWFGVANLLCRTCSSYSHAEDALHHRNQWHLSSAIQTNKHKVHATTWLRASQPLKMKPIGCPETSVRNYQNSLSNKPEVRSSLHALVNCKL